MVRSAREVPVGGRTRFKTDTAVRRVWTAFANEWWRSTPSVLIDQICRHNPNEVGSAPCRGARFDRRMTRWEVSSVHALPPTYTLTSCIIVILTTPNCCVVTPWHRLSFQFTWYLTGKYFDTVRRYSYIIIVSLFSRCGAYNNKCTMYMACISLSCLLGVVFYCSVMAEQPNDRTWAPKLCPLWVQKVQAYRVTTDNFAVALFNVIQGRC